MLSVKMPRLDLLSQLQMHASVVDQNAAVPLLKHTKFVVHSDSGVVRFESTNMEQSLLSQMTADVNGGKGSIPFVVMIPTHMLLSLVSVANDANVTLEFTKETEPCTLVSGRNRTKIFLQLADGFPDLTSADGYTWQMDSAETQAAIATVYNQIATDDSRYGLNGAWLEFIGETPASGVRIVATDGHRLAIACVSKCGGDSAVPNESGVLVPRKFVKLLKDSLAKWRAIGFVDYTVKGTSISVKVGTTILMSRLLEGDFPDYRQVLPKSTETHVTMDRETLLGALTRVSLLSPEKSALTRVTATHAGLDLLCTSCDLGDAREPVEASDSTVAEGAQVTVGINAKYVIESLKVLQSQRIRLRLNDGLRPIEIVNPDEQNESVECATQYHLVMPMRIE